MKVSRFAEDSRTTHDAGSMCKLIQYPKRENRDLKVGAMQATTDGQSEYRRFARTMQSSNCHMICTDSLPVTCRSKRIRAASSFSELLDIVQDAFVAVMLRILAKSSKNQSTAVSFSCLTLAY